MQGKITDKSIMLYGRYKGRMMENIPPDYLLWMWENNKGTASLREYLKKNLEVIKQEIKQRISKY
jgi:uncharacterized protein (DUF3820 family)